MQLIMKNGCVALLGLAALLMMTEANALIELSPQVASIPMSSTDWDEAAVFSQFDGSLGTLSQVTLTLDGSLTSAYTVKNTNSRSKTITVIPEITLSLLDGANLLLEATGTNSFSYSLTAGGSVSNSWSASVSDTKTWNAGVDDLSGFVGSGSLNWLLSAWDNSSVAGSGGLEYAIASSAGATATLTYKYEPYPVVTREEESTAVPEPGSMAIGGAGAAILLSFARRRNSARR